MRDLKDNMRSQNSKDFFFFGFAGLHSMPSEALFSQSMLFGESVTGASAIARMREHHHDDDDDSHEAAQGANKNADRKHSADHGTDMNASNKHTGEKTSSKKAAAINGSCSGSGGEVSNFMRDLKDNMRSQNSKDSQMLTTSSSTESPALKASRNSNGSIAGGGPLADSSSADASGVVANGGDAATANQQRQVTTEVEVGVRRVPDALQQTILQSVMWSLGNSLLSGGGAAKAMQMDDAPPMVKQHSEQQQMKKQSSIASQGSSAEGGVAGGGGGNSGREDSNDGVSDDTPQQSPTPRQQQQQPVQPVLMSINPFGGRSVTSGPALRETIEAADGTVYVRSSRVLGTGSFGCVYMGMEQHTGRLVAMKFLPLPSDADEIHVLQNEVETMETVMDANLVEFYGYAFVDNMIVLMMECLVAGSLSGMLTTFETLPEPTTINFVRDVLKGLHRLHSMGIVHRDVKPQNVLIAANGHCKISDFGASASINELARRHEGGAEVQGTPIYLAPEAARGHAEPKSDVWSVGIMYLQLITGSIPYDATAMSGGVGAVVFGIGSGKLHPIIPTNLTPFARAFVDGCLAVNVDQRLTANDLLRLPLFDGQF
ncbi:protein kinase, putative [Bodo saltans]|uniref:Protein kinase, putative n=1 Tax=Bodo saltans TaxID=75058 RepID=A0A0S4IL59_BODSA|nr:protein kinase, putative [Bodo saltans]|eukprot:CUF21655.1 protein kinase, putative [Bodo saltans]